MGLGRDGAKQMENHRLAREASILSETTAIRAEVLEIEVEADN